MLYIFSSFLKEPVAILLVTSAAIASVDILAEFAT